MRPSAEAVAGGACPGEAQQGRFPDEVIKDSLFLWRPAYAFLCPPMGPALACLFFGLQTHLAISRLRSLARQRKGEEAGDGERENPCGICGHYHKYEEGEVCGECGHRLKPGDGEGAPGEHESAFPTEVLKDFLNLGSYSQASRSEVLKTLGISHILNECERNRSCVLVHCMSGKNRSAAFVAAFLMKSKGWRLAQCFQWVKDRRPQVQLSEASQHELLEYEQKLFGPGAQYMVPTESFASLGFGFARPADDIQAPAFNQTPSIFERVNPNNVPANFTFGAEKTMGVNPQENNTKGAVNPTSADNLMDRS